ncbi:MAG: diguanylate cyclase, partial [Actinobacteria bacterium]|nr:diguanylate cyclase [Actinomycetota bacterium]
ARSDRLSLVFLAAGAAALCLSDSVFVYLTAIDNVGASYVDLGWFSGFSLLALAPLCRSRANPAGESPAAGDDVVSASFLPYIPVACAGAVTAGLLLTGHALNRGETGLAALVLALVLGRQYTTVRQNAAYAGALLRSEAEMRHQAFHDALTGLANRALFHDRLAHALDLHRRDLRAVSVLFLDLDDFKVINDTLGHAEGDRLLLAVAERLRVAVRTADTVARLGGDEFAVLLEDAGEPLAVVARIEDALDAPFSVGGIERRVSASLGLVALGAEELTPAADELLGKADTAMYAAKRGGKSQLRVFTAGMQLAEVGDSETASALAGALESGQLAVAYQPVVDIVSGQIVGLEALARWQHGDEHIPPDTFIPVAERSGLIDALTDYVLEQGCSQLAAWSRLCGRRLMLGINVSPHQLGDARLVDRVCDAVLRHGLA